MNKIFKKIGEKIKQFVKFKNKLTEEDKNLSVGTCYFNKQEIGHLVLVKVEFKKSYEDKKMESSINKSYEFSAKLIVSPSFKRMCKRIIENKKLFNILRHTRKNRTKKKLAKRINKNNKLNKLDK